MSCILGIDPGQAGALALLDSYGELIAVFDMPVVDKRVSPLLLADLLTDIEGYGDVTAVVEQVGSMPKQGVASSFKFGVSYGVVLGCVAASAMRVEHVVPAKWKRDMRLTADKELSRRRALDRWPRRADWFKLKKHSDRAEAALLALWWHERLERNAA